METKEKTVQKTTLTIQSIMNRPDVIDKLSKMLGKKSQGFITSVLQIANSSELLKNAEPLSVYNAAMMAATLDLPLNNNLGFSYIVPYKDNKLNKTFATFQVGYKGYVQLAQRTGQYETISATEIYEGQLISENPLTGAQFDFSKKRSDKIIGFAAFFKLTSGFQKTLYWSYKKTHDHGKKYAPGYDNAKSAWKTDEISMCCKTVLKQLISKYGPMSVEMQKANVIDDTFYQDTITEPAEHVDVTHQENEEERRAIVSAIDKANTPEDLAVLKMQISAEAYLDLQEKIDGKIEMLNNKNTKK